jgi:hypothetical protein
VFGADVAVEPRRAAQVVAAVDRQADPVIQVASGPDRKCTAAATSSGVPSRSGHKICVSVRDVHFYYPSRTETQILERGNVRADQATARQLERARPWPTCGPPSRPGRRAVPGSWRHGRAAQD